jgi:hypothetical protein
VYQHKVRIAFCSLIIYVIESTDKQRCLTGGCPNICEKLPAKQRTASALAVSMVAFVGCNGDIEGAARAVSTAAANGDLEAFSAGLTIGATVLSGESHQQPPARTLGICTEPKYVLLQDVMRASKASWQTSSQVPSQQRTATIGL